MLNKMQIKLIADNALKNIEEHKLSPKPDNYRLWFEYGTGGVEGLNTEIDELITQQIAINQAICTKLYQKYLFTGDQQDLDDARIAMGHLLSVMVGHLQELDSSTNRFCQALHECTEKLNNNPSVAEIKHIIQEVTVQAQQALSSNQEITSTLESLTSEISTLREDVDRLGSEAVTDSLTEIANRRGFDIALRNTIDRRLKTHQPCALLMIDLDHFKRINDTFGHQVGDKILRFVANTLKKNIRGGDILARYGGEEFTVILPNTHQAGALKVAENLLKEVSARQLTTGASSKPIGRITMSIGLTLYKDNETLEGFIERADQSMYLAKSAGRNQIKTSADLLPTACNDE